MFLRTDLPTEPSIDSSPNGLMHHSFKQAANQPTNQSVMRSNDKSIKQSCSHSVDVTQSVDRSIDCSVAADLIPVVVIHEFILFGCCGRFGVLSCQSWLQSAAVILVFILEAVISLNW